jgi:cbb3-type cytochrome oxidase maturation protein
MNIVFILGPLALLLGGIFVASFFWVVKGGQYDDLETPAHRMLHEHLVEQKKEEKNGN